MAQYTLVYVRLFGTVRLRLYIPYTTYPVYTVRCTRCWQRWSKDREGAASTPLRRASSFGGLTTTFTLGPTVVGLMINPLELVIL